MNWIVENAGSPASSPLCRASQTLLAAAYLVVIVNFVILSSRRKPAPCRSDPFQYVSLLLAFCTLTYAGDVLVSYWPRCPAFSALSVLPSVAASVVALAMPRHVRALIGDWSHEATRDAARAHPAAERERVETYERIKAHVGLVEDSARRSAWIEQSHAAMRQLGDMLSELDTLLVEDRSDTASGAVGRDAG